MAVTVTVKREHPEQSGMKKCFGTITMDGNYQTDGVTADFSNIFSNTAAEFTVQLGVGSGYLLEHDQNSASTGKIIAWATYANAATPQQVASTTNLATVTAKFIAVGYPRMGG